MADFMSYIYDYGGYALLLIGVCAALVWGGLHMRNKMIFTFNHRTMRLRKDGEHKEIRGKAGFVNGRDGTQYFRLKLGRFPWQKIDLIEHPDLREMDGDNTVHYTQLGPAIFLQSRREVIPQVIYTDYVRDDKGELVQMRDDKGEAVFLRNKKGELMYEEFTNTDDQGKSFKDKKPIPIYIPLPEDFRIVEEITPISNSKKAYGAKTISMMARAINSDPSWKTAAVWVGGVIMIIIVAALALYFMSGGNATT